ncbi:unnamed protein product [Arabis nemorensis]|uniref:Uncharacterized protein n=1 Tax=Arabis nemorensis TaxID=586526 RepID=A0A565BUX2_9BRAS|nr:unnamed protein product [Arabis nemorensis]
MALFVRLLRGNWIIGPYGRWEFQSESSDLGYGYGAHLRGDESYEALLANVRRRFLLEGTTLVALTYRIPPLMPEPISSGQLPTDILTDSDVGLFMAIRLLRRAHNLCDYRGSVCSYVSI